MPALERKIEALAPAGPAPIIITEVLSKVTCEEDDTAAVLFSIYDFLFKAAR